MMPGDPIDMVVDQKVSAERKEEIRHEMGYDQPFLTQYKNWVSDVVHGDFGTSTRYKMQVWDLMEQRIPYSLKLCGWSLILEIAIALPLGLLCAVKKDKFFDRFTVNSSLLLTDPGFLAGSLVYPAVCGRTTLAADQRLYFRPKLCASNRNNRPFRYGRHLAYYESRGVGSIK